MRKTAPPELERGRVRQGEYASLSSDGLMGAFQLRGPCGGDLVILSTGPEPMEGHEPWEHVSVSLKHRCPNWLEMVFVKALFFEDEETVVQFHPPRSQYVNCHPYVLHLWRPLDDHIKTPPSILVGPLKTEEPA
jgi:hypothetical protein